MREKEWYEEGGEMKVFEEEKVLLKVVEGKKSKR